MAATAISLQLRPSRHRLPHNPNFINFFSSSSSSDESPSSPPEPQPQTQSTFASYFENVKSSLKQSPSSQQRQQQHPRSFYPSSSITNESSSSKVSKFDEVRRNLSEFRRRTTATPPNLSQQQPFSFQELYKLNVPGKDGLGPTNVAGRTGKPLLDEIRQNLKQMRETTPPQSQGEESKRISLDRLKGTFKLRSQQDNNDKLPKLLERETWNTKVESDAVRTAFVKNYNHQDLGNKLRMLRPEVKGKNWFSLTELNERLRKMREIEAKEANGANFLDIRECLVQMQISRSDKADKNTFPRTDVLGALGKTADFMLLPPKEQLVEKYFHPDNLSSSEKLKIELKRVRDEFKMSESDCGSARVQVAQLTTKIKHLSATLHKKDKHSRKGLQGMVQRRKKLLKYLRRTDWDSYCLVLSRLGLRDNPDYKN